MFKFDNQKIQTILDTFSVDRDIFDALANCYTRIQEGMSKQYLAHMIRTMEVQLQQLTGNPFFKIIVYPMPESDGSLDISCAAYKKNCCFSICYPPHMDERQLRVALAHELGHLYLIEYMNNITENGNFTKDTNTEPLSTVFGILAIMDKNDFYATIKEKQLLHKTWEDIIQDFKLLANRNEKLYNTSM